MRGPTFVFTANLNMENEDSDVSKWILSGTCLLMSDDWELFEILYIIYIYEYLIHKYINIY